MTREDLLAVIVGRILYIYAIPVLVIRFTMALWQYTFLLIPKPAVHLVNVDDIKDGHGFIDDEHFWALFPTKPSLFEPVGQILGVKKTSWSRDIIQFGDLEKSCCEISVENQLVISVRLRIDFTSFYSPLLNFVTEFCLLNDFALLDENLSAAQLNTVVLTSIIQSSPQSQTMHRISTR